jgi:hypothetical protein
VFYPTFYSSDTGALSSGLGSRSVRQATHHHLAPRLRTSGAIPPFPLYTFMTCVSARVKDILLGSCKERQYVGYRWRFHGSLKSGTFCNMQLEVTSISKVICKGLFTSVPKNVKFKN